MTKYAVVSDIHANYDALELVLKDAEKRNVDEIVCLGDLVNKYFQPEKVVDAIKEQSSIVVKGNHEEAVTTDNRFKWVRGKLGIDRLNYLENLPLREQLLINNVLIELYHATPNSLNEMFNPTFQPTNYAGGVLNDYKEMFTTDKNETVFTGHTHASYIAKEKDNDLKLINNDETIITNKEKAIINAGSVGEINKLKVNNNGNLDIIIPDYITYAIIDDAYEIGKINVKIIKIPYANTLKKIYFDRIEMEKNNLAPKSPNDDKKIKDSLIMMGYSNEDLKKKM